MGISTFASSPLQDPRLQLAIDEIKRTYGDDVYPRKTLIKYGSAANFGTSEVLVGDWGAKSPQLETYVSTNAITHISSSSGSDTGVITYEYHTIDSSNNLTFGIGTITLQGQTKVALPTACARVSRLRYTVSDIFTANVGAVYVYEDDTLTSGVPNTASKIHAVMPVGEGSTFKCATSFSQYDYFVITNIRVGLTRQSGNGYATFKGRFRQAGNAFITGWQADIARDSPPYLEEFNPYFILRPNTDAVVTVTGSTTALYANAQFSGVICTKVDAPI